MNKRISSKKRYLNDRQHDLHNTMAQHGFPINGVHGRSINPNILSMAGSYHPSFPNNFAGHNNAANPFSSGTSALFDDDELLDGLSSPTDVPPGMSGGDFDGMGDMNIRLQQPCMFNQHHNISMEHGHFSSTPDGEPIQSPFAHGNFGPFCHVQHAPFGRPMYAGSPMANADMHDDARQYNSQRMHQQLSQSEAMQRRASNKRSPMTPKTQLATAVSLTSESGFDAQPIRMNAPNHEKHNSAQWFGGTPSSFTSLPGSTIGSPPAHGFQNPSVANMLRKGGVSMPAQIGPTQVTQSQEAKRKRRRESHNLVERRRRDNINERIQYLSKLVPGHRLEDEKVRKAIQNGTPLSPTLGGLASASQATSGLAGPGARRATCGAAGNITTGLPIDEKDKGPNKGDILNGAVSWTRDLMWMLHLKISQQEELMNVIIDMGGKLPFQVTEDERRMHNELMEAMARFDDNGSKENDFSYSRTAGSGLRVPGYTDYKGEQLNSNGAAASSIVPHEADVPLNDELHAGEFINDYDVDSLKEEDDAFDIDMTS